MTSSALYWSLARGTVPITMSTGTLRLQQGPAGTTFNWADKTKIMNKHMSSFLSFKGTSPLCRKGLLVLHLTGQTRQRS